MSQFAFGTNQNLKFVIKNITNTFPKPRDIKVFELKIRPGQSVNLLNVPGVTEDSINASLFKGELKNKIQAGHITVTESNIELLQYDAAQKTFLQNAGVSVGLEPGTPLPSSGTNASAVSASDGANGWIVRQLTMNDITASAYSSQQVWYVDPVSGVDTNTGVSAPTALKTIKELDKRLRIMTLPIYEVHVLNDLPITDPIGLSPVLVQKNDGASKTEVEVYWYGQRTVVASGAFTANGTTSTPASNLAPTLTNSGVADWTTHLGKTLVVTSGASLGFITHILKNVGAGVARCNYWHNCTAWTPLGFPGSSPAAPPLSGDTYNIVTFTKAPRARTSTNGVRQYFNNFDFTDMVFFGSSASITSSSNSSAGISFISCKMDHKFSFSVHVAYFLWGCCIHNTNGTGMAPDRCRLNVTLCGFLNTSANGNAMSINYGSFANFGYNVMQNARVQIFAEAYVLIQNETGVFDSGSGFLVGAGCSLEVIGGKAVYGDGNVIGMELRVGSSIFISPGASALITITGTTELSVEAIANHIPPLVSGAVVPTALPCTTWAQWVANFSKSLVTAKGTKLVEV